MLFCSTMGTRLLEPPDFRSTSYPNALYPYYGIGDLIVKTKVVQTSIVLWMLAAASRPIARQSACFAAVSSGAVAVFRPASEHHARDVTSRDVDGCAVSGELVRTNSLDRGSASQNKFEPACPAFGFEIVSNSRQSNGWQPTNCGRPNSPPPAIGFLRRLSAQHPIERSGGRHGNKNALSSS